MVLALVGVAAALVVIDPLGGDVDEPAASWRTGADPDDLHPGTADPTTPAETTTTTTTTTLPPTTTTAPPTRLAPAPTPPAETGAYGFIAPERDGDPITWDPCETIQYVVNSRTAPAGAPEILAEAIAAVSAATGLVFEDLGPTDEVPVINRPQTVDRYGDDWAPVLISWTDPAEVPTLADLVAGQATPSWASEGEGEYEIVTGFVHLDGPDLAALIAAGDTTSVRHIVMHELGHLVGLDHVEDPAQVMFHNRDGTGQFDAVWNPGDLQGLAIAGTGTCNPDV